MIGYNTYKEKNNTSVEWTEEEKAAYKLVNIPGVGNKSIFKLLEHSGSVKDIFCLSETKVEEILEPRSARAFLTGKNQQMNKTLSELEEEKGLKFIPYTSQQYPQRLRNIPNPPFCLYVKGKLPDASKKTVAVIGARACSEYGKTVARYYGRELGRMGIPVISGMARGIDGIAQNAALEGGGESYAVLGCGADVCYPPENVDLYDALTKDGGIISEYPPGTEAKSNLFPPRNRIISGLADVVLVIEARKRSGTYITVLQALEQGKDVYAVPGRITDVLSEGCNFLLAQGAGIAVSPETVFEELSRIQCVNNEQKNGRDNLERNRKNEVCEPDENNMEQTVLSVLDITPVGMDRIFELINAKREVRMEELLLVLTKLQIKGKVVGEGNYYRLAREL